MTTARPGVLLLLSSADGLGTAVRELQRDAQSVQAARRSEFTSIKRDDNGQPVALAPLAAQALVEVQYADPDARDRAIGLTERRLREDGRFDWQFAPGNVHDIVAGSGAVTVAFFARRRDGLTRVAFHDYWLNHHALIAQRVPNGPSYRQLHVLGEFEPWDGITTMKYTSYEVLAATRASATVAVEAYLDERTFIDHARSSMAFFEAVDV